MKLTIDRTARTLKLEVPEGLLDVFLHPGSPEEEES
jgi:hypothetical protein